MFSTLYLGAWLLTTPLSAWLPTNAHPVTAAPATCGHVTFVKHLNKMPPVATNPNKREDNIYIYWTERYRLEWNDYVGDADYHTPDIAALTASGIVSSKGCKDGFIDYEIKACFDKTNSWVKPEAYTNYHLAHEQGHFDITETYARILYHDLALRKFKCGEEVEFESFIDDSVKEWERAQKTYDYETAYSTNPAEQHRWLDKIKVGLDNTTRYPVTD
jgi:hypothetical protein